MRTFNKWAIVGRDKYGLCYEVAATKGEAVSKFMARVHRDPERRHLKWNGRGLKWAKAVKVSITVLDKQSGDPISKEPVGSNSVSAASSVGSHDHLNEAPRKIQCFFLDREIKTSVYCDGVPLTNGEIVELLRNPWTTPR